MVTPRTSGHGGPRSAPTPGSATLAVAGVGHQAGVGERVTGRHDVAERLVHVYLRRARTMVVRWSSGGRQMYHRVDDEPAYG